MADEIRDDSTIVETNDTFEAERPTGDAEKGALMGGVGGLVTGAFAGSAVGPVGAVIGAVVGGVIGAAASGAAVAAVDKIDDDNTFSGLPDDMSLDDDSGRNPMIIDRNMRIQAPPLDNTSTGNETPIGVGMPEAIALTGPINASTAASADPEAPLGSAVNAADLTDPANAPIDRGGVSGDAETLGTMRNPGPSTTDGGWDRDNDANQIDVNPAPSAASESVSGGFAYADNPEDDRRHRESGT